MEIVIIVSLLFSLIGYFLIKWIYKNKKLRMIVLPLIGLYIVAMVINNLFFKKMEFIQSRVYPQLYLIKNPISDKDSLEKAIKTMVIQKMNTNFIGNEIKYKKRYNYSSKTKVELDYEFSFFEYYKGWGSNPIGEAGTAHFIENKEDPGGFSSEYLELYRERFQIAEMKVNYCNNDTINYIAILNYYEKGRVIVHDTILNLCK